MKGTDIPQIDSLEHIRNVVQAVADGKQETAEIETVVGLSTRHINYAIQAAHVLELLVGKDEDNLRVTRQGKVLLGLEPGSDHEKTIYRLVVECNRELKKVAPGLLEAEPPEVGDIIRRIEVLAKLSTATAKRRAQTLLAWRQQIMD